MVSHLVRESKRNQTLYFGTQHTLVAAAGVSC